MKLTAANLGVLRRLARRIDAGERIPKATGSDVHHVRRLVAARMLYLADDGLAVTERGRVAVAEYEADQRFFGNVVHTLRDNDKETAP